MVNLDSMKLEQLSLRKSVLENGIPYRRYRRHKYHHHVLKQAAERGSK